MISFFEKVEEMVDVLDRDAEFQPKSSQTNSDIRGDIKIIAVVNQKGGVGKTTTAINLATGLAAVGKSILIVDLDPQGNASTGLNVARADRQANSYTLLAGETSLQQCIHETMVPGLSLIPSTVDLSAAEMEFVSLPKRNYRLKTVLEASEIRYDYVLIDCPPSLGLLTINALVAADAVLVPLQCEFFALEGLALLMRTIDRIKRGTNPQLQIMGIVLTMFDRRNRLSSQVADEVRQHLGDVVFETIIPRNVRVSEAPSHGKPALLYDHRCAGSHAYIQLAREILKRQSQKKVAS